MPTAIPTPSSEQTVRAFTLETFFPYQVRMFYLQVSQSVSAIYGSRYGLSVSEWRTLAVLGNHQPLSASDVVQHSSIDKVQVSRAIKGLLKRDLLQRSVDPADRRRVTLHLTEQGLRVFDDLVLQVRALEQQLLGCLSEDERQMLKVLMNKVREQAERINANSGQDDAKAVD